MDSITPNRPQKRWFYSGRWTKPHDTAFINMLHIEAENGRPQNNPLKVNKYALKVAADAVSRCWHWSFQPKTYKWQLERLRLRYTTFKTILECPGFEWDRPNNRVMATRERREVIRQEIPFADAYIQKGEHEWEKLRKIFEPEPEADEAVEVHVISSGDDTDTWPDSDTEGESWDEGVEVVDLMSSESEN